MADRKVHPDCPNASNPYHECFEECYMKIANGKTRKSSKKPGYLSGGNLVAQRVPKERKANQFCPKAANPYHECGDHCFQNGSQADTLANRKQTGSAVDEAPMSRRKNSGPNPQIKPATEVLGKHAKGPVTSAVSAVDAPPSRSQFPSKEREPERAEEDNKPLSPPLMYAGETRPEDFSFNKRQSGFYSVPTSGNATPVLGLSPDRCTLRDHLNGSFATVPGSTVSKVDQEEDNNNRFFSSELVLGKVVDSNNGQVAQEAVRGSMSLSISDNSCSPRNNGDEENNDCVQPALSESCVPVGKYHVKSSISSILQAILEKYGDIAENCQLESTAMRSYYLECVCFVVQELQSTSFMNLTKSKVKETLAIVKDLESAHIEVGWLRAILNKLSEVAEFVSQHQTVRAAKVKYDQAVESARRELDLQALALAQKEQEVLELKGRVAETEERLRRLETEASQLDKALSSLNLKVENFHLKSSLQELM